MNWFWNQVDASGDCWVWAGARHSEGYGRCCNKAANYDGYAHRYSWETLIGPIPEGFQIDHLCRNRLCVNPDHLEPVPPIVNLRRSYSPTAINKSKTHCLNGHPFDRANTYIRPDGDRNCKTCQYDRSVQIYRRIQAARPKREPSHGASAYSYRKCRCDICRTAKSEENRRYRLRKAS